MREEIEARPSAILIAGLILGLIALPNSVSFLFLTLLCVWVRPVSGKCFAAGAFVLGLVLCPVQAPKLTSAMPVHAVGLVRSVPSLYPDGQMCEFEVTGERLELTLPREPAVMLGDRVEVSGVAKPLGVTSNLQAFSGIQGRISSSRFIVVGEGSWIAHLADRWRRSFMAFLGRNLAVEEASMVDAICFNARTMLEPQTRDEMARTGVVHIVSASGLQVFVLGALLSMALRFVPVPRWAQILLLAMVLCLYAVAAGLQPQIVRACVMTLLGLAAYLVRRDPDALSALSLAGFAYLLWRPEAVYQMAFQLSFVTVACLALFFYRSPGKGAERGGDLVRFTKDIVRFSWVMVLATTPLIAYYIGSISVVTVFANLMLCWCLPLVVGTAFVAHCVSLLFVALGDAIASSVLAPMCHWIYAVVGSAGGVTGMVSVPSFSAYWLVAFYGAWLMTYRRRIVQP